MRKMKSRKYLVLKAVAILLVALGTTRAAVTLSLLDTNTGLSNLTSSPGDAFSDRMMTIRTHLKVTFFVHLHA